jgi:hypothetical protein
VFGLPPGCRAQKQARELLGDDGAEALLAAGTRLMQPT